MSDVFSSRSSFELAAFFVTWAVVTLLVVLVANLHARVRRLEQAAGQPTTNAPYGHLVGARVEDLVGAVGAQRPRVLLFLSSSCGTCTRLVEEVTSPAWTVPSALLWTDRTPPAEIRSTRATILDDGPRISARLGIRVTPFALVADEVGRIVRAGPISTLQALADLNEPARQTAPGSAANGGAVNSRLAR
jgi:hypothetical protein